MNVKQQRAEAKALFLEGKTAKEIAQLTGLSETTVYKIKLEVEDEQGDQAVDAVSNLDPRVVIKMADRMLETHPQMATDLQHLAKGLNSLAKLEPVVHDAVGAVITKAQERLMSDEVGPAEFKLYGELILKAYATLYNRPTTQVNIQQNTTTNNNVVAALRAEREDYLKGLHND